MQSYMKRLAMVGGIAAIVFSASFALAASMGVSGAGVGAGTTSVAACDSDGVAVTYSTTYDETIDAYEVDTVTVSDIDSCSTKTVKVTLDGSSGNNLGSGTGTVSGATDASVAISVASSNINVTSLAKLAVLVG